MGQLRVPFITLQLELLDVTLLHWKQAVAMKVAILENTQWFKKTTYVPPPKLPLLELNRKGSNLTYCLVCICNI